MNLLNRIMSYDKTKINQENCNCEECVSVKTVKSENQIVEYPKLSEEEIEQIIFERYSDKDDKTKTFIRKALRKHGDRYDYSNVVYIKATVNVEIICRVEGHKPFPQTPDHHLREQGCPKCNKNKGEDTVRKFLSKYNIEFKEQKTFEGCRNVNLLRFDFYLPKYNLCIESDGAPHFKKINWTNKMTEEQIEENFKRVQNNDKIKDEYCKKNNITLLRVKADKAMEELSEYFQNNRIVTI